MVLNSHLYVGVITEASRELRELSAGSNAEAKNAAIAMTATVAEKAFIVPCTWEEWNAPGYSAVAAIDWALLPDDHPLSVLVWNSYKMVFAPFSPTAPHRVALGAGNKNGWMVIEPIIYD